MKCLICWKCESAGKNLLLFMPGYISEEDFAASEKMKEIFETREFFLLSAREEGFEVGGKEGAIIIAGHTPTIMEGTFYNKGKIWKKVDEQKNCTFYDIDCGAAYGHQGVKHTNLSCLRLDDLKEFYVRSGRWLF